MDYKFKAVIKKVETDEDGEGKVILLVPLTEQKNIIGLNLQVKRVLDVAIKEEQE